MKHEGFLQLQDAERPWPMRPACTCGWHGEWLRNADEYQSVVIGMLLGHTEFGYTYEAVKR